MTDLKETQPFTYLIGWTKENKWYYGSKYAKGCQPEHLWTKYWTSSYSEVDKMRKEFGEPDHIEVRQLFDTAEESLDWEAKFLKKVKALQNQHIWLNRNIGGKEFANIYGRSMSEKTRKKQSDKRKSYYSSLTEEKKKELTAKSGTRTPIGLEKMRQKAIERYKDKEWMENVYKPAHNTPEYLALISKRRTENNNTPEFKALVQSPEYKAKHKEGMIKRWAKVTPEEKEVFRKRCSDAKKKSWATKQQSQILSHPDMLEFG